jgi:hypothetical protein
MPLMVYNGVQWIGVGGGIPSGDMGNDSAVNLNTYVYRNATNTGLAGVKLAATDLNPITVNAAYRDTQYAVYTECNISGDIRLANDAHVTLIRCKVSGHIDCDGTTSFTAIDCDIDAGTWTNAAIGFNNLTLTRCNISGGITSANVTRNNLIEDCYCHGQYVDPVGSTHTGAISCFGNGGNLIVRRTTIWNDSVDNSFGGGPSGNFQLYGDNGPIDNVLVEYCYLPATAGGFSTSLGLNPGKPGGDNPTHIVFRHNIFGKNPNGKGGAFGTVTSWLDDAGNGTTGVGNQFYDNVWQDGSGTITPNVG